MDDDSQCFIVQGTVQGVGMRYMIRREADKLSLTGYAKNLSDGTVEVQVFGTIKGIVALKSWLLTNPGLSNINRIDTLNIRSTEKFVGFEIL